MSENISLTVIANVLTITIVNQLMQLIQFNFPDTFLVRMKSALIVCLVVTVMCINTMVHTSRVGKIVMVTEKDQPKFLTDRDLVSL